MAKRKKKKLKLFTFTINPNEMLINLAGKLSSADPEVRRGTGWHKSEKDYDRKKEKRKLKKQIEKEMKEM